MNGFNEGKIALLALSRAPTRVSLLHISRHSMGLFTDYLFTHSLTHSSTHPFDAKAGRREHRNGRRKVFINDGSRAHCTAMLSRIRYHSAWIVWCVGTRLWILRLISHIYICQSATGPQSGA